MHHKFVVLDFDRADARVYFGSYNFSEPADGTNGENLLLVKDRTVATSYMIEAVRLYDHYRLRSLRQDAKGKGLKVLELKLPPAKPRRSPGGRRTGTIPSGSAIGSSSPDRIHRPSDRLVAGL